MDHEGFSGLMGASLAYMRHYGALSFLFENKSIKITSPQYFLLVWPPPNKCLLQLHGKRSKFCKASLTEHQEMTLSCGWWLRKVAVYKADVPFSSFCSMYALFSWHSVVCIVHIHLEGTDSWSCLAAPTDLCGVQVPADFVALFFKDILLIRYGQLLILGEKNICFSLHFTKADNLFITQQKSPAQIGLDFL